MRVDVKTAYGGIFNLSRNRFGFLGGFGLAPAFTHSNQIPYCLHISSIFFIISELFLNPPQCSLQAPI